MSCQMRWRVASSGRLPARRMRQTPCSRHTRCNVQKIATIPPATSRRMSGRRTGVQACKRLAWAGRAKARSASPNVLRCSHAMTTAKPLDLTLEVAPKARFDVVELRSRFAAEHEALAAYSNCLYWSSHTTAGFLDRSISARLRAQNVSTFVEEIG